MPTSKTDEPAPSRRDQQKSRRRLALRAAALELFASQGFDMTTTEQISERAGVSARTFFRYFPTKESVLFFGEYDWVQAFTAAYRAQPDETNDADALRAAIMGAASGLTKNRQYLALYERAVASSPTLRGREQDHQREDAATVARAIAARRGLSDPDEQCTLLASVALLTYRRALDRWLAGPAATDVGDAIAAEFDLLSQLFRLFARA